MELKRQKCPIQVKGRQMISSCSIVHINPTDWWRDRQILQIRSCFPNFIRGGKRETTEEIEKNGVRVSALLLQSKNEIGITSS